MASSALFGCGCDARKSQLLSIPDVLHSSGQSLFNKQLPPKAFGAWDVAHLDTAPSNISKWHLHNVHKADEIGSGGILCCRLPRWSLFRERLGQYLSAPDLASRIVTIPGLYEKNELSQADEGSDDQSDENEEKKEYQCLLG